MREVQWLARLDHPNVIRYYTAWIEVEEDDQAETPKLQFSPEPSTTSKVLHTSSI